MAAAEQQVYEEMFMEERLARLETHVEHIRKDQARIETKIDRLDEKADTRNGKLEAKVDKLIEKVDEHHKAFMAFQIEVIRKLGEIANGRLAERVWLLLIGAALLGVMARGFKWI